MTARTPDPMRKNSAPPAKKLDDLYKLIDGIEIAMFTTRRPDGHLVVASHGDAGARDGR